MTHRATAGGCALGFAVGWNISNVGAIADTMSVDYGVALATVGLFTTALFVVHAALQIPAGRAVDRLGARRIGFASLTVISVANLFALIAPDPALAIGTRALAGLGTALGFVAGIDYVRSHGGSPFAQGLYGGIALAAGGVALAVVPQLVGALEWRAAYWSALAVAVAGFLALAFGPSDRHRSKPAPSPTHAEDGSVERPSLLRDRRLYRLCLLYAASFGLSVILGNWVVTLLERGGDYSNARAGLVGSLILVAGVVSRPMGGWALRRYPDRIRPILAASFACAAAGTLILTAAGPPAVSAIGALVLGLAAGIPFAASFSAAARVRPDAPAAAIAMVNMAANILIVAGTPLVGLSFSLPGDGRIGFLAATAIWLLAVLVVPAVRELDPEARSAATVPRPPEAARRG